MRRLTIKEAATIGAPKSWFVSADGDGTVRLWRRTKTNRYRKGRLIQEALPQQCRERLRAYWARPERETGYIRVRGDARVVLARYENALRSIYLLPNVPREIADLAEAALMGRLPRKRLMDRCIPDPCKPDLRNKACRTCSRAPR